MKTNKWRKNLSGRRIEMGLCFAKRSLEGWGSEEKKIFLATLFLLKQKAGVMKESPLSLVSRTKYVFSWRKTHSSEGNQTQWTFLKDTSLLLKEKQSCQKKFFFPKFIILPMISRQNKTPVSILLKLKFLRHLFVFILRTCPVSVYFVTWRSWFFFLFAEF